ncbi:MAG TPA: ABC transporter permease [Solirubrobacterales bacterium]|nr:ABC transporter permease [Solirubrobacterales bacterium]
MPDRSFLARARRLDSGVRLGLFVFALLLVLNLIFASETLRPENLPATLGLASPLILTAFAVVPTLLVGNGGIDLSVGPAAGLVNVVVVYELIGRGGVGDPVVAIAVALAVGLAVGLANGILVAYLRIQPIVATLGTYLVCSGITLSLLSTPGGSVPNWLVELAGNASFMPIVVVLLAWFGFTRLPLHRLLVGTSDDERAVYTSGIDTARVKLVAYACGGLLAGVAGISLSAVLGSADPTVGPNYTLTAIAAAVLGGVSLAGSRGGMVNALLGALAIFLLQNLLTSLHASPFLLQVAYGAVLVAAVALNGGSGGVFARARALRIGRAVRA